jgi:nucleotide-binding universal stress UspA family protein
MVNTKHWIACLDLSKMDDILIGYTAFLSARVKPDTITFFHTVESGPAAFDIIQQFPEIETQEDFENLIRNELQDKIEEYFNDSDIEVRVVLKEGKPTDQIIDIVRSLEPDLLLVGKKIGYSGEGIVPKRILNYVPCSVLFVPENSRYQLGNILVPVDFSDQSIHTAKTALELAGQDSDSGVTLQHIYRYRAQFFPYVLSDEEKEDVKRSVQQKMNKFIEDHKWSDKAKPVLSLHKEGKVADEVYDQAVHDQADLIIVAGKSKKITSFVRHDFTDKMVDYAFGIPLLVQKNPEKHQKFLKSIFN